MMRITLLALFALLCTGANAQFAISGKVTDFVTGQPLVGALVRIQSAENGDAADIKGNFEIRDLQPGEYTLKVQSVGYADQVESITIHNSDVTINFELRVVEIGVIPLPRVLIEQVEIEATRAGSKTPMAFKNISREEIDELNNGQDLPYMLRFTPSLVTTSDAGAGIGYTGLRIRGSDASRINVTINGIPLNDSESQGVFWVNLPDLSSSVNDIQIQRGVGTSANGAGSFGGTIKVDTERLSPRAYARLDNTYGSFNTWKNSISLGSGLLNDSWSFTGRLSRITSDGYIDRASSNLSSYYLSGTYLNARMFATAIVMGGQERTYQSWYGTPQSRVEGDEETMLIHAANNGLSAEQTDNLLNSGRTYNFYTYDNEVDDYKQDHYQLHLGWNLRSFLELRLSGHYTYGRGFFEQYKEGDDYTDYGLPVLEVGDTIIESTDLVRRRWLENDFYGAVWSMKYLKSRITFTLGGAYNEYDGDHFGELIWMQFANGTETEDLYYLNNGFKKDFNSYARANVAIRQNISAFMDLQYRLVDYRTKGVDADRRILDVEDNLSFFNPKAGIDYRFDRSTSGYVSYSIGNREPTRNDYIDAVSNFPKPEQMQDLEIGIEHRHHKRFGSVNVYYMKYRDQLVLTGELNDVGTPVRQNVPDSYRRGIELEGGVNLTDNLALTANATFSQNKIQNFSEYLYDYGNDVIIQNEYSETNISFSPSVIAGGILAWKFVSTDCQDVELAWMSKYVGKQYLDNTSNEDRVIDPYFVNDVRITYTLKECCFEELRLNLLVNNVLNSLYASNGYTYSYLWGDLITENFYYPQAGTNFLLMLNIKFGNGERGASRR